MKNAEAVIFSWRGGGVKSLRIGAGKNLGLGGLLLWGGGGVLLLRGSVPYYMPQLFQISHNCVTECMLQVKFLLKLSNKFTACKIKDKNKETIF